ncbi:MAG: hypothetical protein V4557_04230 [Bacteroidota bacterium]
MRIHGNYISFSPYLFEFNIRVNQYDSILDNTGQKMSSITFDTASIYLIDINKKLFFEFDSFKTNAKLISSGQLQNKKYGAKLKENKAIEADTAFTKDLLRDTIVFGKKLSYYSSVEKNVNNADSMITHIFFLKNPNFISIHDIPNRLVKDGSYSMVGFSVHLIEQNVSVSNELEVFQPLNQFDEKICIGIINTMVASKK